MTQAPLPDLILEPMVRSALMEDLGSYGDITTRTVIPADTNITATLNAREAGVVSGLQVAALTFRLVDPDLKITMHIGDGEQIAAGDLLMEINGSAASILSAERVALNFAGRLSGIATLTSRFVRETVGTAARITCTRKTTPGLRLVEKTGRDPRRRVQPPLLSIRCDPDQGQPHRSGWRYSAGTRGGESTCLPHDPNRDRGG